jgi:D-lactate dehydrogenase
MKISFYNTKSYDREYFDRYNPGYEIIYMPVALNLQTALLSAGSTVVCAFVNDSIDQQTISVLKKQGVELIAMRCAGYNNVDLRFASEQGIKVVRVPAYSPHAVAEHTMALILTLNRKTHKAYNRVREGNFSVDKLMGFDLYEKTVGVVGIGKIGACFAAIAKGFGCRVLAFDILASAGEVKDGIQYEPLDAVLSKSDIISLHCPLTPETYHLVNEESLAQMKAGAMLINTSRGALIDTHAVIDALITGHLGYLGIDVYEQEEHIFFEDLSGTVIKDDMLMRLMTFPNVLITAHQGFFTSEALTEIARTTFQNIAAFEQHKELVNEVIVR